jgi:hypothetical protein
MKASPLSDDGTRVVLEPPFAGPKGEIYISKMGRAAANFRMVGKSARNSPEFKETLRRQLGFSAGVQSSGNEVRFLRGAAEFTRLPE